MSSWNSHEMSRQLVTTDYLVRIVYIQVNSTVGKVYEGNNSYKLVNFMVKKNDWIDIYAN